MNPMGWILRIPLLFEADTIWRIPGCPLSIIFLAPFTMVAVVVKGGGRHPAVITLAGGGTFAGLMVVLQPNAFAFILGVVVGLAALMLWQMVKS